MGVRNTRQWPLDLASLVIGGIIRSAYERAVLVVVPRPPFFRPYVRPGIRGFRPSPLLSDHRREGAGGSGKVMCLSAVDAESPLIEAVCSPFPDRYFRFS